MHITIVFISFLDACLLANLVIASLIIYLEMKDDLDVNVISSLCLSVPRWYFLKRDCIFFLLNVYNYIKIIHVCPYMTLITLHYLGLLLIPNMRNILTVSC
jgi:hypothetical protein